jgi:hypothetical protein
MTKLDAKLFLEIWEKIAQQEHLTDRGLSLKIGITPSAVTHWRSGRTAFVMPGILVRLEKKLGYRVKFEENGAWRLQNFSKSPIQNEKSLDRLVAQRGQRSRDSFHWPLAARVSASERGIRFEEAADFSPIADYELAGNVWARMDDESMGPIIPKGSWLLVRKNVKPKTGDIGLIAVATLANVLIGVVSIDEHTYQIAPANGKSFSFKPEEILSAHRVLAVAYHGDGPVDHLRERLQARIPQE